MRELRQVHFLCLRRAHVIKTVAVTVGQTVVSDLVCEYTVQWRRDFASVATEIFAHECNLISLYSFLYNDQNKCKKIISSVEANTREKTWGY